MGRITVAVTITLWSIPMFFMVNRIVPEPYMDEIFHIPQAQQYCRFNFTSWDPLITTPPGLYCLSLALLASLFPGISLFGTTPFSKICSSALLRSTNCVLAVISGILFYAILKHTRPHIADKRVTVYSLILALYPLHWFFSYLYYTDVASTVGVLAMYLACLKKSYWSSALLGALAITIRQTNVVWMVFVAILGTLDSVTISKQKGLLELLGDDSAVGERGGSSQSSTFPHGNARRRKTSGPVSLSKISSDGIHLHLARQASKIGLINEIQDILCRMWYFKLDVLLLVFPYLLVFCMFVAFVMWNGGIVLGAKDAHAVSPHLAQMLYFGFTAAAAMGPVHFNLSQFIAVTKSLLKSKKHCLASVLVFLAGLIVVHFFSIAHPYLLADNRHYPFYLWKKVIRVHWLMKYLLVPLYTYSWFSIFNILGKSQKKICIMLFFLSCAAVLVPAPLIEFRYYTLPFYFLVLQSSIDDDRSWYATGLLYIVVNLFTMYMFLFRPFHWDHEAGVQRFLW